jgi:hypothetical protein
VAGINENNKEVCDHLVELIEAASTTRPKSWRRNSSIRFHQLGAAQLQGLWKEWEKAGLLDRILSFGGGFEPRFVRGSTTTLSNHSFGSAFDINVAWNERGHRPALVGEKGSVRELVPIAHKWGFW